jgi:hypothetical protein
MRRGTVLQRQRSQTTNVLEGAGLAENGCPDCFLAADDCRASSIQSAASFSHRARSNSVSARSASLLHSCVELSHGAMTTRTGAGRSRPSAQIKRAPPICQSGAQSRLSPRRRPGRRNHLWVWIGRQGRAGWGVLSDRLCVGRMWGARSAIPRLSSSTRPDVP